MKRLVLAVLLCVPLSGCIIVTRGGASNPATLPSDTAFVYSSFDRSSGTHTVHAFSNGKDAALTGGWNPRLSPDGRSLSYQRGGTYPAGKADGLYALNLETNTETTLFSGTDYLVGSSWTQDGSGLVFDYECGLQSVSRDGSVSSDLRGGNCYDDAPSVNPVNGQIAFHNASSDNSSAGLWVMDSDGGNAARLPNTRPGDAWPAWSPDGAWISFLRTDGKDLYRGLLYRIRPDGSDPQPLLDMTLDSSHFVKPTAAWTPDGRFIIAAVNGAGGTTVNLVAADGSGATYLNLPRADLVDFIGNAIHAER